MDIKNMKDRVNSFILTCLQLISSYANAMMIASIKTNSVVTSSA